MADKESTKQAADNKAADEAAKKLAAQPAAAQDVVQAAAAAPHPSLDKAGPTSDPDVLAARGRAEAQANNTADEDDDDDDIGTPNLGKPVGKPIRCVVIKKFYSEEGQVVVPGKDYYLQLYEGQTFPSDVLEPVDEALARKFRKEFREKKRDRAERKVIREQAREAMLSGGAFTNRGQRPSQVANAK